VIAVSAAQFLASAAIIAPIALVTEGVPGPGPTGWSTSALLAAAALATVGTVLPYTLFAIGQTGVAPQIAGAFLNLETLVAAAIGATLFGEAFGLGQAFGALALLVGIYVSTVMGEQAVSEAPAIAGTPRLSPLPDLPDLPDLPELPESPALAEWWEFETIAGTGGPQRIRERAAARGRLSPRRS
jgi:hypothetical protein